MSYCYSDLMVKIDVILSEKTRIRLGDIASMLQVSRHTHTRVVRKVKGDSFRSYQRIKVLAQAANLLSRKGELSGKQIAGMLGYQSPDAFYRFVYRATGITPSGIRTLGTTFRLPD